MGFSIDRIDGLMSVEEARPRIEAQRQAQEVQRQVWEEAQEAERQAREEANRYDPSKFTIVPSDFQPAKYTSIDLFDAVVHGERSAYGYDLFVSEVVFVNQDGTNILFRTADNSISLRMKIDSRSGLTSGQRIRLYYSFFKRRDAEPRLRVPEWNVIAIERL
jgi:hypothetical protein